MRLPDGMAYQMAGYIFKPGMECDNASWLLNKKLPDLLRAVAEEVKQERGKYYLLEKEQPCVKHMDHGKGEEEPEDPDCPCRATSDEWECAYNGCGFCRAAQEEKQEFGDA